LSAGLRGERIAREPSCQADRPGALGHPRDAARAARQPAADRSHRGQPLDYARALSPTGRGKLMPLKLKLAAHERLVVNGAVMVNGGGRTSLIIRNFAHIMREKVGLKEGDEHT